MISLEKYSDKCYALFGDTKEYKDQIKEIGGKYNPNLKGRAGWIFPLSKKDILDKFVSNLNSPEKKVSSSGKDFTLTPINLNSQPITPQAPIKKVSRSLLTGKDFNLNESVITPSSLDQFEDEITVEYYTPKSFAVFGNTKNYKNKLVELGGKYNPSLKGRAGWVFSNKNKSKVDEWYDNEIACVEGDDMETISTIACEEIKVPKERKMVPRCFKLDDEEAPPMRLLRRR